MNLHQDQIQQEIKDVLDVNGRGVIIGATGSGKTRAIILHIKGAYNEKARILHVVPTEKLRDYDMPEEHRTWGTGGYNIQFICYKSLPGVKGQHYDLVVLDEGHNVTKLNSRFFLYNTFGNVILCTATYPEEVEKRQLIEKLLKLRILYTLPLSEAEQEKVVPEFDIYLVRVPMRNTNKILYNKGTKLEPKWLMVGEREAYEDLEERISKSNDKELYMERYSVLTRMISKADVARAYMLQAEAKGRRVLVFMGLARAANRVSKDAYHTKNKNNSLEDYVSGKINHLVTVGKLDEGANVGGNVAIVASLQRNPRRTIQRIGRALRKTEGRRPMMVILVSKGTIDERNAARFFEESGKQPKQIIDAQ